MIEFDATILVQMVNFFVFLIIINSIFFKPLVKNIQERRDYISSTEKKISDGLLKLEEAEAKFKKELDDARQKAQEIINGSIAKAEEEKSAIISAATEETQKSLKEFKDELLKETEVVRKSLESEINTLAGDIAEKIISASSEEKVTV